jgi:hypothetical protein
MKKLVIKTASITLAVIIGIMALTFGALCLFAPKTVARLFDGAGGYSPSVFFYEKQYNKTQSTDDLYYLVLKLDDQKDPTKTREYLSVFLQLEDVEDYCKTFDTTNNKMYMCFGIDTTNKKYTWTQIIRATDIAGNSIKGVVDVRSAFGMSVDQYGRIYNVLADEATIAGKTDIYKAITANKVDYAVKQGLAYSKLEGTGFAWTEDEKKSARALIGATNLNTHANYGVQNNNSGLVMVVKATDDEITNKSTAYKPIVPTNLDFAIVQGLINNSITLDDTQKSAIQTWLGLGDINTALETILGV